MTSPAAPISSLTCEVYQIPTDQPEGDGTLAWTSTTMVLARVRSGPVEGIGWTYAGAGAKATIDQELSPVVTGADAFGVPGVHEDMVRACRNLGRPGEVACGISAVDIALWDLKARLLDVSLCDLFGRAREDIPVYGSGGFTTYDDATTTAQLESWLDLGITRVKIKIGESWGARAERDLQRVALARRVAGPQAELFVDANGAYDRKQAVRLGRSLVEDHQVSWFEEPVSSDDRVGLRVVRDACDADIAAGEYGYSPWYFVDLIGAGAVDCVQVDVTRCGGYTDWLAIAEVVRAHHLQVSGHCAPSLHRPVASAVTNLRHLEYFHDHVRLEQLLFDGTTPPVGGALDARSAGPGHGLELRQPDAERFRVA